MRIVWTQKKKMIMIKRIRLRNRKIWSNQPENFKEKNQIQ